jgi:dihydrofolate reductase
VSARPSGWTFDVSQASADYLQPFWDAIKVTVIGRHLFDNTNGWDGAPAAGDELVVVTHRPLPETWISDHSDAPFHTAGSVEAGIALAKKLAGDGLVCVTAGDLGGQAFSAGLVDEVAMDVAPVVLGEGQPEHDAEGRSHWGWRISAGGEHCLELQMGEAERGRLGRHCRPPDVLSQRMIQDGVYDGSPVEVCDDREPPRDCGLARSGGLPASVGRRAPGAAGGQPADPGTVWSISPGRDRERRGSSL